MKKTPVDLRLKPQEVQRQWTQDEIPVLCLTMSLPLCTAPLRDRRIRRMDRYYGTFRRSYEAYCGKFLFPQAAEAFRAAAAQSRPFLPWQVEAHFSTTLRSDTLWSLTIEATEKSEKETFRLRRADTWDLRDGYPLALADFFPGEPLPLRRLRRAAKTELLTRQEQGAALRPDWKLRLRTTLSRENFYLTEGGLVFYYPMYALGDTALGIPSFFLPWTEHSGPLLPLGLSLPESLDKNEDAVLS